MDCINSTADLTHLPAAEYIKKPFNPILVKRRVENILELKSYQDSLELKVAERTKEIYRTQLLIMKKHCEIGKNIIGEHESIRLKSAQIVAYEHHERWD